MGDNTDDESRKGVSQILLDLDDLNLYHVLNPGSIYFLQFQRISFTG